MKQETQVSTLQEAKKVFIKYPSHRNLSSVKLHKLDKHLLEREYVSTEKLHGTNTGLYVYPDGSYKVGSRRQFVIDNGDVTFQSMHDTFPDYVDIPFFIEKGLEFIQEEDLQFVIFYGEFFGKGVFNMDYVQVQENRKEFLVFNVLGARENKMIVSFGYDEILAKITDKNAVPLDFRGTLSEMIEHSKVVKDHESNFGGTREGFVIQATERFEFLAGTEKALNSIKIKGDEFKEVIHGKSNKEPKTPKYLRNLEPFEKDFVLKATDYINMVRLESVVSHTGVEPTMEDAFPLAVTLIKDAFEDMHNDSISFDGINEDAFAKKLVGYTVPIIKQYVTLHSDFA